MRLMKSQVATTVSGHVFAYPTVTVSTSGSLLQPQAPRPAAQDVAAPLEPIWPIEFAAAV